MAKLEIFWSFRSPYSYLAIDRLAAIKRDYDVDIDFRPVRPLALREPEFFKQARKQWLAYLLIDAPREAGRLGLPFAAPDPDPVRQNLATGEVAAEQPYMDLAMRLGVAAVHAGLGLEFAQALARSIWSGKANWHEDDALAETLSAAAIDLDELQRWADDNPLLIAETIEQNEAEQGDYHWGVPLMVLEGEPFFGQDRIDALIWRLDQRGLKRD